jgi:hypothetical protein
MKKIFTTLAICSVSAVVFAQGTIQWSAPGSAFIGRTNSTAYSGFEPSSGSPTGNAGVTVGSGTSLFYYALLTSAGLSTAPTTLSQFTGSLANAWLDTGLLMNNATTANGRLTPVGGANTAAVAGNWASGSTQSALLVGWSANLGTTWLGAGGALANLNNWATFSQTLTTPAFFGLSGSIATGLTPSTANPGIVVIGTGLIDGSLATGSPADLRQLFVPTIPEPGTMALAALGGASLLLFRRKK